LLQLQSIGALNKRLLKYLHDMHVLQVFRSCDRRLSLFDRKVGGKRESKPILELKPEPKLAKIAVEECDNQPKVATVTHSGTRTGPYVTMKGKGVEQWIIKSTDPRPTFNPQEEKETYQ
jgi:hypothetical protein